MSEALGDTRVVTVNGARRVGTSTLVQRIIGVPPRTARGTKRATVGGMRTRISTTVDNDRLVSARAQTGLPDSELFDKALGLLLERAEEEAEDRALAFWPYEGDPDLNTLPTGWPEGAPPLDGYDGEVPADVVALFAARRQP